MALGFLGKSMKKLGYPGLSNSTLGSVGGDTFYPNWLPNLAAWYDLNNTSSYITGTGVKLLADLSGNSGTNVLALNGVTGNNAQTPSVAANSATSQLELIQRVALDSWVPAARNVLVSKRGASGNFGFFMEIESATGKIRCIFSFDGTNETTYSSTVATPFSAFQIGWVRITWTNAGTLKCYTAPDAGTNVEPTGGQWTQLGTDVATTASSLFASTANYAIGQIPTGGLLPTTGKIYYSSIRTTVGGAIGQIFDPSTASKLASSFVSSTGETWTINTTGDLGARICGARDLVNLTGATQPTLSGGGMRCTAASSQYMRCAQWNGAQPLTRFSVIQQVAWSAGKYLLDGAAGANTGAVIQTTGTPQINLSAGTSVAANTNMAVGANAILTQIINGASSSLQVNNTAATTGNAGAAAANGLTVGANGAATAASFSDTILYEHITYTASLDVPSQQRVIQYLSRKWGIPV